MEHKAVAFIRKTPDMPCLHGTHNGYVAVPPTNKYHGKHYFDIKDIKVHGDITFTEPVIPFKPLFGHTTGRQSKTIWMCFMKLCDE